jgi:outer membrane protein TolC
MMIRRAVTGWIVAAALASPVAAAGIEQLTLRDAIMTGVERNHLIKAARHVSDAAQAGATAAQLHFMPSLTLEESWARTNIPVNTFMMKLNQGQFTSADMQALAQPGNKPATLTDYTTSATLEQPLFVPTAWAGARVARLGAERQQALASQTIEQIALRIYQGYLDVYKSHAYLQLAEKAGLKEKDVILEMNGQKITPIDTLAKIMQKYNVGDSVMLKVLRGGDEFEVQVQLTERQD